MTVVDVTNSLKSTFLPKVYYLGSLFWSLFTLLKRAIGEDEEAPKHEASDDSAGNLAAVILVLSICPVIHLLRRAALRP